MDSSFYLMTIYKAWCSCLSITEDVTVNEGVLVLTLPGLTQKVSGYFLLVLLYIRSLSLFTCLIGWILICVSSSQIAATEKARYAEELEAYKQNKAEVILRPLWAPTKSVVQTHVFFFIYKSAGLPFLHAELTNLSFCWIPGAHNSWKGNRREGTAWEGSGPTALQAEREGWWSQKGPKNSWASFILEYAQTSQCTCKESLAAY